MIFCKQYEVLKIMKKRNSIVFQIEPMKSDIEKIMENHEKYCIEHNEKTLGDKS